MFRVFCNRQNAKNQSRIVSFGVRAEHQSYYLEIQGSVGQTTTITNDSPHNSRRVNAHNDWFLEFFDNISQVPHGILDLSPNQATPSKEGLFSTPASSFPHET